MHIAQTENRLVDTQPGVVIIFTGIHTGDARLTVEARNGPPTDVSAETWDEIAEVSFATPPALCTNAENNPAP